MERIIKTTINIKPYLKKRIIDASETCDVTISIVVTHIILKIIHKFRNSPDCNPEMFTSVKYQDKYKPLKWDQLHISYNPAVYEVANDLRKLLKKTVSKYIAEGIEEFLEEIINELCKNKVEKTSDNYFPNYYFTGKNFNEATYFTIFWGLPIRKTIENYLIE